MAVGEEDGGIAVSPNRANTTSLQPRPIQPGTIGPDLAGGTFQSTSSKVIKICLTTMQNLMPSQIDSSPFTETNEPRHNGCKEKHMRKMNMGGSVPRQTTIQGQRHDLAYINPFEVDLLESYNATPGGVAGPGGVPAYPPGYGYGGYDGGFGEAGRGGPDSNAPGMGPGDGRTLVVEIALVVVQIKTGAK